MNTTADTTTKAPQHDNNEHLKGLIAQVIAAKQTPPELLKWASNVDTPFLLKTVDWILEESDVVAHECRQFLRLIEYVEAHGIERVKQVLIVAEYVVGDV